MIRSTRNSLFVGILSLFVLTFWTGCADSPTSTDDVGYGGIGVVGIGSEQVSMDEAIEVRTNARRNENVEIEVEADEAADIATQEVPGEVLGVHLDYDRDTLNYECVVRSNGKVYLVVIDPTTGKVKSKSIIKNYYYVNVINIRIINVDVEAARDTATAAVDGDVVEANVENIDGRPIYIIVILTQENRYITVYVDAQSGERVDVDDKDVKCRHTDDDDDNDDDDGDDDDGDDDGDDDDEECKDGDKHKNKKGRGHHRHGKGHGYGHHYHCNCDCDCDDDDDNNGGGSDTTTVQVITRDSARVVIGSFFGNDSVEIGEIKLIAESDSVVFYETVVESDSNRYEVKIDARNGALVEVKQTAGDFTTGEFTPPASGGVTFVPLSTARTAASAQLAGTVMSWQLEYDASDAAWIYTFDIKDGVTNTTRKVRVNATTGAFIDIQG